MPTSRPDPAAVRTVTCAGTGVIGGGWVAYFLAKGYDVVAWDPAPGAEERLGHLVDAAWPALTEIGLRDGASRDRIRYEPDLGKAVAETEFVQESAPEDLELKRRLLAEIDDVTPEHVVISSSTSGYPMTDMQVKCAHPERTVVGHPFNPPYLIPLVEVVGGEQTDPAAVAWASEFFTAAGKSVITMDREVPGFIANRLQEALWREALHMVAAGEATVEQIDQSITDGPGLRWPVQGPMLTFHLAGGQGGMAHMLDHFGPSLKSPWTRLQARRAHDGAARRCGRGLRARGGRSLDRRPGRRARLRRDRRPARTRPRMTSPSGEPVVWREPVLDEWIDYNGHLSEPYYVLVLGHATDAVMDAVGLGPEYRASHAASLFTVEAHVRYLDQVEAGVELESRSWVIGATGKLLWIWHELYAEGRLRATEEILGVHVDTAAGRTTPFPDDIAARIAERQVEPPEHASRQILVR